MGHARLSLAQARSLGVIVAPGEGGRTPYTLGVDPGHKGGLAFVYSDGSAEAIPMPLAKGVKGRPVYDLAAIIAWVRSRRPAVACVERVNAAPMKGVRQGTTAMFNFGVGYGQLLGLLEALGVPVVNPTPQRWKKAVLGDLGRDKEAAIAYCRIAFPAVRLIPPRCRKEHDGIADALCLAEYGRRHPPADLTGSTPP